MKIDEYKSPAYKKHIGRKRAKYLQQKESKREQYEAQFMAFYSDTEWTEIKPAEQQEETA